MKNLPTSRAVSVRHLGLRLGLHLGLGLRGRSLVAEERDAQLNGQRHEVELYPVVEIMQFAGQIPVVKRGLQPFHDDFHLLGDPVDVSQPVHRRQLIDHPLDFPRAGSDRTRQPCVEDQEPGDVACVHTMGMDPPERMIGRGRTQQCGPQRIVIIGGRIG